MGEMSPVSGQPAAAEPAAPAARPVAFVDASAIVALVDADDPAHAAAVAAYRDLVGAGYKLFTTDHGVAEAYDLLRLGLGSAVARRWLERQRLAVYHVDAADLGEARRRLLDPEAVGLAELSLTDVLSLVVMDRLGVGDAFAVDPRFLAGTG
jgi:predicted nucleic acid-binding protein